MAGLWFGQKKPFPLLFLNTISDELVRLRHGIDFELPNGDFWHVKAAVIAGTCDLPAKAVTARIYPFRLNLPLRTQHETNRFANEAHNKGEAVCGVKGPSAE
ncbi:hypothetical protein PV327_002969 [Microctonus hyperodae]|uniref:Uncharacterized protein n=1 Tax=Microctonus hyperodae TaxID=165561 RepID=A0AA39G3D7_MICHY|nr:hypothetical protein PV327_002969 [Microctonus hyperodae]